MVPSPADALEDVPIYRRPGSVWPDTEERGTPSHQHDRED